MSDCAPHIAFSTLHGFILGSLCDVYLVRFVIKFCAGYFSTLVFLQQPIKETTKRALWNNDLPRIAQINTTLNRVVQPTLVQLSVFMPFVAQHLYEKAFNREPGSIYFDFVKVCSILLPEHSSSMTFICSFVLYFCYSEINTKMLA